MMRMWIMFLTAVSETEFLRYRYEYWEKQPKDQYKVDMECLVEMELQTIIGRCYVHEVFPEEIQSHSIKLL